ncbi:hypothetical protein [Methylophaga sp.]|uniref:hypothetical protein n=1 Tax=Methylophaga sp. TaxID=2024840 RepID=UPI003F6983C0
MNNEQNSTSFKMLCRALMLMFAISSFGLLAACDNDGPAEEAGEQIDETIEEAGDTMEDAADEAEDAMD